MSQVTVRFPTPQLNNQSCILLFLLYGCSNKVYLPQIDRMSVGEKRERCRQLQQHLATSLETDPNPQEVIGALATELDHLALYYNALLSRLPAINQLLQDPVRQASLDEIFDSATAHLDFMETIQLRSVPSVKETTARMRCVALAAKCSKEWVEYDVTERMARDYVGIASDDPPVAALVDAIQRQHADVTALLDEARHRYTQRQLLQKAKQMLESPLIALEAPSARWIMIEELTAILRSVAPDKASLSPEAAAVARQVEDVKQLLELFHTADALYADVAGASQRLTGVLPMDPTSALHAMEALHTFAHSAQLQELTSKQEEVVFAASALQEAATEVKELHNAMFRNFSRLRLLPLNEVELLVGSGAAAGNKKLHDALPRLFSGWESLRYSSDKEHIEAIVGESGEALVLVRPVACGSSVRPDVYLSRLLQAARDAMYLQLAEAAKHAHEVVTGFAKFDVRKILAMTCQGALTCIHILTTSLVEGALKSSETAEACDATEVESARALFDTPMMSVQASRLSSRPLSASQRVSAVTRMSAPSVVSLSDPRPGSASPGLFKKSRESATPDKKMAPLSKKGSAADLSPAKRPLPRLAQPEDDALSKYLSPTDVSSDLVAPILHCPVRDRKLSSNVVSANVAPLIRTVLAEIVKAKLAASSTRSWWFDALASFTFQFLQSWECRIQQLSVGDAAWRREPRLYFTRGAVLFELGAASIQHELEFSGWMHRAFVLTPTVHEAWCKISTALQFKRPTGIVGSAPSEERLGIVSMFAAFCGKFLSVFHTSSSTTFEEISTFLSANKSFGSSLVLIDCADAMPLTLQATLARGVHDSWDWANVLFLGADSTVFHGAFAAESRFCYIASNDGFCLLQTWLAVEGFASPLSIARRLSLVASSMQSVCNVAVDARTLRKCILAASKTMVREGHSVTEDLAMFTGLRAEIEPLIPSQHKGFFSLLGQRLFSADSNVTFYPQIVATIEGCCAARSLRSSDAHLQCALELFEAVSAAPASRAVVGVLGPSGSGKTTLATVIRDVFEQTRVDDADVPSMHLLSGADDEARAHEILDVISADTAARHWLLLTGIAAPSVGERVRQLLEVGETGKLVVILEAESAHSHAVTAWNRCLSVYLPSTSQAVSWMPLVAAALSQLRRTHTSPAVVDLLQVLFDSVFQEALEFAVRSLRESAVIIPYSRMVHNTLLLLTAMLTEHAVETPLLAEQVFWLAVTWATATNRPRCSWDAFVAARLSPAATELLPKDSTILDVCLDAETHQWVPWAARTRSVMRQLHQRGLRALLPTIPAVSAYVIGSYYKSASDAPLAICGPSCSGKTLLACALSSAKAKVINLHHSSIPTAASLEGDVILDGPFERCRELVANVRYVGTRASVTIASRECSELLSWCSAVFMPGGVDEPSIINIFGGEESKTAECLHAAYQSLHSSPHLRSLLSAGSVISAKLAVGGVDDSHTTTDLCTALSQHWVQRCESSEHATQLRAALASAFAVVDDSKPFFLRDPTSGALAAFTKADARELVHQSLAVPELASFGCTARVAALVGILGSSSPAVIIRGGSLRGELSFTGDIMGELECAARLLSTGCVNAASATLHQSLAAAAPHSDVIIVDAASVVSIDCVVDVELAVLRGVRVAVNAVGGEGSVSWSQLCDRIGEKAHRVFSIADVEDLRHTARECIRDAVMADAVADMFFHCGQSESFRAVSVRQFFDAVCLLDDARASMEADFGDKITRASDVIKFMRRVELAVAGKSVMSAAEQQYEVREETSNRALEGRIAFRSVPAKPVRLIAQFTVNYDDGRIQEVAAPSVFFGTTREDVVAIPAVNGGTCRCRCDGKQLAVTTGILDFQVVVETFEPLILSGNVTDPAQGNAVVGSVRLIQVVEGENVFNKKWLRYGQEAQEDESALIRPQELPSEEQLHLNRIETDRYVSRVGGMSKALQVQIEQMVLQRVYTECSLVPGYLAGRTLTPLLLQLPLEERTALVRRAQQTPLTLHDPLSLKGLASLLQQNMYELELWLMQQRAVGLPYGNLAEQNAAGLRFLVESARRKKAERDEDDSVLPPKPIVVLDDDSEFVAWALVYCRSVGVAVNTALPPTTDDAIAVHMVSHVTPVQRGVTDVIATKHTQTSLASKYQMMIARPEPGSNPDKGAATTLQAAVASQALVQESLAALTAFLHDQYEVAEAQSSVVNAIIEMGKDRVPQLMDAIKKTKDTLSSADSFVDRGGNRWKSIMDNAAAQAERVALLHVGCQTILPKLSMSYTLSAGYYNALAKDALSASGKNATEASTKAFLTPILLLLRLDHRLTFCACLAALVVSATGSSPPLHMVMRSMREADVRQHIAAERQMKLDAAAAFEEYKMSVPGSTAGKAKQQQSKKDLKDFLPPEIKPSYSFLTYSLWVQLVALAKTVPAFTSLTANLQHSDTVLKGGMTRQEKWAEWASNPNLGAVPTYEKDVSVTALDKFVLLHVFRPERTTAAALQLVAETLGAEIPDPLAFDDLGATLASLTSKLCILFKPRYTVSVAEAVYTAMSLKAFELRKDKSARLSSGNVVELSCTTSRAVLLHELCGAVQRDDWIILTESDEMADASWLMQWAESVHADYLGMVLFVCQVEPPNFDHRRAALSPILTETTWPRVACNESDSVRSRMQRFYQQNPDTAVPITRSVSHRLVFLTNFLVSAVAQRCRYEHLSFSEPERLDAIDADVNAAALILQKQLPTHSARHWDEARGLLSDVVGSCIRDPRDRAIIQALIDWLIHPDVASQEQLGFLQLPAAATLSAHMDAVAQLAAVDAAENVGLAANEDRRLMEREGRRLMSVMCELLSDSVRPTLDDVAAAAEVLLTTLPPVWAPHDLLHVQCSTGGALDKFLAAEVDGIQRILSQIHAEVAAAAVGEAAAVDKLSSLAQKLTPRHWLKLTLRHDATPHRHEALTVWLESLTNRVNQLMLWTRQGCPRVCSIGYFLQPAGFLAAYLIDACSEVGLDASEYHVGLTLVPPAQAQTLPLLHSDSPLSDGIFITGIQLEGASLSHRGAMQDPADLVSEWWRDTSTAVPLVKLCLEKNVALDHGVFGSSGSNSSLSRIQEAISFSRANATMTTQRPSSAAASSRAVLSPVRSDAADSPVRAASHHGCRHVFKSPLYRSALRRYEDYICDIPVPSAMEHNYWMIRGVVALCEPN